MTIEKFTELESRLAQVEKEFSTENPGFKVIGFFLNPIQENGTSFPDILEEIVEALERLLEFQKNGNSCEGLDFTYTLVEIL